MVESLVDRNSAIGSCVLGVIEALIGTFTIICAFIMLGGFCDSVSCTGITRGLGFWMGFPLLIPGILGLIVLGTRHVAAVLGFIITNILVLIFAIVHAILSYQDYSDFWKEQKSLYKDGKCAAYGPNKCACSPTATTQIVYPYRCDLITMGFDLNWILFSLSIVTIFFCLISTIVGIVAKSKVKKGYRK